jgi:hypothetical protein
LRAVSRRTIPEAAAELRVSARALRKLVADAGLYEMLPGSNRKRLTEDHFKAVRIIIAGKPCPSSQSFAQPGSTISGAHTLGSALTEALALARLSTQKSSRRKLSRPFSNDTSKAPRPSSRSRKPRLIICAPEAKADT